MTLYTRIVAIGALLGAIGCGGQPGSSAEESTSAGGIDPSALAPEASSDKAQFLGLRGKMSPLAKSLGQSKDGLVTVVVELSDAPVAVLDSESEYAPLSDDAREMAADSMLREQNGLQGSIEAQGGQVLATFQHALNGIKVRIPASRILALHFLPGVTAVSSVGRYEMDNAKSVPYIGAPAVWQGPPGIHGEDIKVAVIDTGLDFTHANFGGPGTADAYSAAHSVSTAAPPAALVGPGAPKVKGGVDLVGDDYNADPTSQAFQPVPHPDANPLDCNGHGSHVGGTIAGFGVTSAGATYAASYDAATHSNNFRIGPGVAPKADLFGVRVFGCDGSTDVVVDAINWVMDDSRRGGHPGVKIQVINMSLGSSFGTDQSADSRASTNAENAGIIVVASAGNSGSVRHIVGSPSVGNKVLSVAAVDSHQVFAGAVVTLTPAATQTWQNSNAQTLPGSSLPIQTLRTANGGVSLGCLESEYMDPADGSSKVAGKLVVSIRGTCARIYRAQAAFAHGAASAALINNGAGYPSFEGDIMSCIPGLTLDNLSGRPCEQLVPANGVCARGTLTGTGAAARCIEKPELVTFAFFGVRGAPATDGNTLAAATSADTFTATTVANPTANQIASFSSSGPLAGYDADGFFTPSGRFKPDIAAPGVSILSTAVGTGNGGEVLSGTSMAAPHVAGVVALALQAHPRSSGWTSDDVRLAVANTASPTRIAGWLPRRAGAGLVQPFAAVNTQVVARAVFSNESNLSYGAVEFASDLASTRLIFVRNLGNTDASFAASPNKWSSAANSPHTITVTPSSFVVPAHGFGILQVALAVPASTSGDTGSDGALTPAMREVAGWISLTPSAGSNGGATLNIPYYMLPRARADVSATLRRPVDQTSPPTLLVQNGSASVNGKADIYSWGASGNEDLGAHGIRALGAQTQQCTVDLCGTADDRIITFAVNTFRPNSQYASRVIEYDVDVTLEGSKTPDFTVFTTDLGLIAAGARNGQLVAVTLNNRDPKDDTYPRIDFNATAPTDGSTVLLRVLASSIGLTSGAPRFTYQGSSFFLPDDQVNSTTVITDTTGKARFNGFTPAFSATFVSCTGCAPSANSAELTLAPAGQALFNVSLNQAESASTRTRGIMVVARENLNRGRHSQALLLKFDSDRDEQEDRGDDRRLTMAR